MTSDAERRAEAAEKTVAVLKRKVVALYNGDTSAMHEKLQAARAREAENRKKREILEIRAAELAKYSGVLEAEVARRTDAMKAILDHVTFGFLRVDRAGVAEPECTRSCRALFATDTVEGRSLGDLLQLAPREAAHLSLGLEQIFEDLLPEEVSLAQLERRFPMRDGRVLSADMSVIRRADGVVGSVLVSLSDITALEAATRESQTNRTLVGILKQKTSFESFLAEARHGLDTARDAPSDEALRRRVVHTIKGNAGSFGLGAVVEACHELEGDGAIADEGLTAVEGAIRAFLEAHEAVLEIDYDAMVDHGFQVTAAQIADLRAIVGELGNAPTSLRSWTARVLARPASHYLGPIRAFTERLAERLGKEVALEVIGDDTLVDAATMRPVLLCVPHLVRNAVDHGIEPPEARAEKGVGRLELAISERPDAYVIRFTDDGRGIDGERVLARAKERGVADTTDPVALVFVDGVSTAEVTTTISGRGVGMGAVKAAVEAARGTIGVETQRGRGTTLTLTVPKPE